MSPVAAIMSIDEEEISSSASFSVNKDDGKSTDDDSSRLLMKQRHTVDFDEHSKVYEFDKLSEECHDLIWYNRDEYDIIKARNGLIVKMMKAGHFSESDHNSFRGLEHKLRAGNKLRRANKFNAMNAVLEEQDRQLAAGPAAMNDEEIAEAYRRVTLAAAESAFLAALSDAEQSYAFQEANAAIHSGEISDVTSDEEYEADADIDDAYDDDEYEYGDDNNEEEGGAFVGQQVRDIMMHSSDSSETSDVFRRKRSRLRRLFRSVSGRKNDLATRRARKLTYV